MYIYKIENLVNGKLYIGKCVKCDIEKYWKSHLYNAKRMKKKVLYSAIRKYGDNNFKFEIIEKDIPLENLNERERYYIKKYNTYNGVGYNCTEGGDGGDTLSNHPDKKDIYKRCAETYKRRGNGWKGKHLPQEMKDKISNTLKDYVFTNEHKENISKSLVGRIFSDEHKENLRQVNLGEKNPMYGKEGWCKGLSKDTSEIIKNSAKKGSKTISEQYKNGRVVWNKGKKIGTPSKESRLKQSKYKWYITDINTNNTQEVFDLKEWCYDNGYKKSQVYHIADTGRPLKGMYIIEKVKK